NAADIWGTASASAPGGFVPIGTVSNGFIGRLDGQNYTISNLYINRVDATSAANGIGLFGVAGLASYIGNVGLVNANVNATFTTNNGNINKYVGGLIGFHQGGLVYNAYVAGGTVTANAQSSFAGSLYTGGLVGQMAG